MIEYVVDVQRGQTQSLIGPLDSRLSIRVNMCGLCSIARVASRQPASLASCGSILSDIFPVAIADMSIPTCNIKVMAYAMQ